MSERKAGWYWVEYGDCNWEAAHLTGDAWEVVGTDEPLRDYEGLIVGSRIPTPDEPWVCVPKEWLKNLHSSIAGDCYMGNEWELSTIDAMLSAAPKPEDV